MRPSARQVRDDAESDDEEFLRPPGQLAHIAPTPLSIIEVLNKVPPFQLGEQIVAEAQRLDGVDVGRRLPRRPRRHDACSAWRGPAASPSASRSPLAVGPEIPREGVAALRAAIDEALPGASVAPMYLRGRAIGVVMAIGAADDALRDLAAEAAAAIALADEYTDAIETVRRVGPRAPPPRSSRTCSRRGSCASAAR